MNLSKLFMKKKEVKNENPVYLWKSMQADLKSAHGKVNWKIGKWEKVKGEVVKCEKGFHASERAIDAMRYVNCEVLCKVEVAGNSDIDDDKQCWSEMRIVEAYTWTKKDSVALSIYAAELVIDIFEKYDKKDKRPREAIEAAKKWLKSPTEKNRNAAAIATYAANVATYAATYAATANAAAAYAANAAANAANAASAATYAAANAANAAANAAYARKATSEKILNQCEEFIQKKIKTLKPYVK